MIRPYLPGGGVLGVHLHVCWCVCVRIISYNALPKCVRMNVIVSYIFRGFSILCRVIRGSEACINLVLELVLVPTRQTSTLRDDPRSRSHLLILPHLRSRIACRGQGRASQAGVLQ